MQEGIFSLMQMAKVASVAKHSAEGLAYHGFDRSYYGRCHGQLCHARGHYINEPGALIGFADPG